MALVTCLAPVNIAVVKYWGKRHEQLVLPLNDSVSATLDLAVMSARTSVCAAPSISAHRLWLNGKEEPFTSRLQNCLCEIRARAKADSTVNSELLTWNLHICSENNFPTAAGLASSAAGYACLVAALSKLYKIKGDISSLARLGSGSACRSVYGGFVQWHAGVREDGSDSIATQIATSEHWPEMRILILVVNDKKKKTSSTNGMRDSVATSELLKYRTTKCVPERVATIKTAILNRDFETFADITMKDSNQFHAICMDTYPPFVYLNEVSHAIIDMVHSYNNAHGKNKIAYTFDAGPNACLYMLDKEIPTVFNLINKTFPSTRCKDVEYVKGIPIVEKDLPDLLSEKLNIHVHKDDLIKYIINTKVGDGPVEINDVNGHLLDEAGVPKFI